MIIQNKKIAITGHSRNGCLGNSIYKHFSTNNLVVGYSRSNGYDILTNYDDILTDSLDCDIFINCVAVNNGQEQIAKKWYELHKDKNHVLVNINCLIPWLKFVMNFKNYEAKLPFSSDDKLRLSKISVEINNNANSAKSIDIAPGMMEFNVGELELLTQIRNSKAEVKHTTIIDSIDFAVSQYFKGNLIPYIAISNTPFSYTL